MREEETESFFITEEEAGERLDKVLAQRLKAVGSRTYFQYLIDEGKVLLNGAPVKKRIKPAAGDEIEIEYILTPELTLKAEDIPLDVIYEDDAILVVNKAPGMVVHPAVGHWTGTFVNALLFRCRQDIENIQQGSPNESQRPGIVHRLDKDTSGLLLAAKTGLAQQRLIEMFSGRRVHKEYLAICVGNPGTGTIDAPVGRHPVHRKQMTVLEGGRPALTHYRMLAFDSKLSLVTIVLATGRTHQIRVHMRYHGTPILGDGIYGVDSFNVKYGADRQMLHAHRLRLAHPITGQEMEFEAPIPQDMRRLMKTLGASDVIKSKVIYH